MSSVVKSCAITRAQRRKKSREKIACLSLGLTIISLLMMVIFDNEFLVLAALGFIVMAIIIDKNTRRIF